MLRVSSVSDTAASTRQPNGNIVEAWATRVGTPKRWYTDDGRTFLPLADTAYLLFFEQPATSNAPVPTQCPPIAPTPAPTFVAKYASDDVAKSINVLRVMALGTWTTEDSPPQDCNADHTLYWSTNREGSNDDLFDGQPSIAALQAPTETYYPNLQSLQRTDRKLVQLLNEQPGLYIQVIFLPDSGTMNHPWRTINANLRTQMWANMAARWAAFPNVFWTITNDTADKSSELVPTATPTGTRPTATPGPTPTPTPTELYIVTLAKEIGCYFADHRDQTACGGVTDYNPWRTNRPLSVGHLRNKRDAFAPATPPATPPAPWHNYITAYTGADLSAQHLDGTTPVPWDTPDPGIADPLLAFRYVDQPEPVLNTEDLYESPYRPYTPPGTPTRVLEKQVKKPAHFFRRLFWSHLLSGSGATYGAETTWRALAPYSTATYTVQDNSCLAGNCQLEGLAGVQFIPKIFADTRIDLGLFHPKDDVASIHTTVTTSPQGIEINRPQVAVRDDKEILIYIPNTKLYLTATPPPSWDFSLRRNVEVEGGRPTLKVNLSQFKDSAYAVTWYGVRNGASTPEPQPRTGGGETYIKAPADGGSLIYANDVVVHISSRCTAPNVCEPMDSAAPAHTTTSTLGINFYAETPAELTLDQTQYVIGNAQSDHGSWRCDRNVAAGQENATPGCVLTYVFPTAKPFASVDYYFRRTTRHAHQSISFITAGEGNITPGQWGYWAEGEIDIGLNPEQDVFSQLSEESGNPYAFEEFDVLHHVPLDSNRWYHLKVTAETWKEDNPSPQIHHADLKAYVDGRLVYSKTGLKFNKG